MSQALFELTRRLGDDWRDLADVLGIPPYLQRRFDRGFEARDIWAYLVDRERLDGLPPALRAIGRADLAELDWGPAADSPAPRRTIAIRDARGVQVGDHNTQHNTFS
jgi:hypothetical protein